MNKATLTSIAATSLALFIVSGSAASQRQSTAAGAVSGHGSVVGVAFDSLLMLPLDGATVFIPAAARGAITDSAGRFRVDSVPAGTRFVALSHPDLDALGLTTLGRDVQVLRDDSVFTRIATPSMTTLRRRACGDAAMTSPEAGRTLGLIFGSMGSALDGVRLSGARVRAAWVMSDSSEGALRADTVETETVTDATGHYHLCDVPVAREISITARAGSLATAATEVTLGARGIARHDLLLALDVGNSVARNNPATIVGILNDTAGRPLPQTRVSVDGGTEAAVTDSEGRFTLNGVPAGSRMLQVQPPGMTPMRRPIAATPGDTLRLHLRAVGGVMLEPVTVRASARGSGREMPGFDQRRSLGRGMFLDSTDIRSHGSLRAVTASITGVMLDGDGDDRGWEPRVARQGRSCVPTVWVDGRLTDWKEVSTMSAELVQAIEYYDNPDITPGRFLTPNHRLCSTAVIWTRRVH